MENNCKDIIDYSFVELLLIDGQRFIGKPILLEYGDETDSGEDEIDIETESCVVGIKESEIKSWKEIKT